MGWPDISYRHEVSEKCVKERARDQVAKFLGAAMSIHEDVYRAFQGCPEEEVKAALDNLDRFREYASRKLREQ